jgi:prepilin-type N-terminal cleavage/methylation domain-containing protein
MKLQSTKTNQGLKNRNAGFTLIEMIGVLAVIAILAAVLIPKVFDAINSSRINNAAMTCNTVKTAIADHYAKFGSLTAGNVTGNATPQTITDNPTYDQILVTEGFLDKAFAVKIGDGIDGNNNITLTTSGTTAATSPLTLADHFYDLDGNGTSDVPLSVEVVEAIISQVTLEDAQSLDKLIDGAAMSNSADSSGNVAGRVKWGATVADQGTGYDMHIYLTHR